MILYAPSGPSFSNPLNEGFYNKFMFMFFMMLYCSSPYQPRANRKVLILTIRINTCLRKILIVLSDLWVSSQELTHRSEVIQ